MSPLYVVKVKKSSEIVETVQELLRGSQDIFHGGLHVPIKVGRGDSVTIFLDRTSGHLDDLAILGFGDDQFWDEGKLVELRSRTEKITLKPNVGESVINLFGIAEGLNTRMTVIRLDRHPVSGERLSR